jgi:hypothetical protein
MSVLRRPRGIPKASVHHSFFTHGQRSMGDRHVYAQ